MNFIYIMVEQDSEQAKLLLSHWKEDECICGKETIILEKLRTEETLEIEKLVFIFAVDKHEKCKDFLKRCNDNPLGTIKLDPNNIIIETRMRQKEEGLQLDKKA